MLLDGPNSHRISIKSSVVLMMINCRPWQVWHQFFSSCNAKRRMKKREPRPQRQADKNYQKINWFIHTNYKRIACDTNMPHTFSFNHYYRCYCYYCYIQFTIRSNFQFRSSVNGPILYVKFIVNLKQLVNVWIKLI